MKSRCVLACCLVLAGCVGSGPPAIQIEHWMHGDLARGCTGTFDTPPRFIAGQAPYMPQIAYVTRRNAVAVISMNIPVSGVPTDVQVQSEDGKFYVANTEAAVNTWRFRPALSKGEPVAVPCTLRFGFELTPQQGFALPSKRHF